MKITKNELKTIIRECLREELKIRLQESNTNEPGYYADSIFAILDDLSNDEIHAFLGEYPRYRVLEGECISDLYDNINRRYLDNYSGYQLYSDLCNFFEVTEIKGDGTVIREDYSASINEDLDDRLYEKSVWLPTPKGKMELSIGVIKDERQYDYPYDDENYEIAVNGFVGRGEEIVLDNEELAGKIKSTYTYLRAMSKEDAYEAVDELYEYFMSIEDVDVVDTLLELCDEYDTKILRRFFSL